MLRRVPTGLAIGLLAGTALWGAGGFGHARTGGEALAALAPMSYRAEVLGVVDGDTIRARVAVWPGHVVETRVRLAGIDAPELRGRCRAEKAKAVRARQALADALDRRDVVLVDVRADKYFGRVVADVTVAGHDVGRALMAAGHAVPYGGGRPDWCGRGR